MAASPVFRGKFLSLVKEFSKAGGNVKINGHDLTVPSLYRMWKQNDSKIIIADQCLDVMKNNSMFLQSKISKGKVIYGVNTGYGGSADVRSQDTRKLQLSLIRLTNAGFGDTFPLDLVRITMVIRANSLCRGYSGVRPEVPRLLVEMVNKDVIPVVPKRGSVSASGDLIPSSYITACMMGRKDARCTHKNQQMTAPEALESAGLRPITFEAKEALAVINASSFSAALGSVVLYETSVALILTQLATAMSVEAIHGQIDSFHPIIHQCMPHPGQIEVASNMRHFLDGSEFVISHNANKKLLAQDRYALRTSPQWLAPTLETQVSAIKKVTVELNSSNDNPLFDHFNEEILHCGNFQGISIAVSMDQVRQSIQLCGKLLFAQLQEMTDVSLNSGLPPNLAGSDISTDFGFKGVDIAMAAFMSELDFLTNCVTNHVLSAEMHNQSVNSLALIAARYTKEALDILQMMIANILYVNVQAIDLRWLQLQVDDEIDTMCQKYNIDKVHLHPKLRPWYRLLFTPELEAKNMLEEKLVNGVNDELFVAEMSEQMRKIRDQVEGVEYISKIESMLGKGTSRMYTTIRRELGIKFNFGQEAPDIALEKLYAYVKSAEVASLLGEIFTLS